MKRVIIVQARMTSTRLPGKILMDLAGRPMLGQQIRRLKMCRHADEIVIATTTNTSDDPVAALARKEDVRCFRGDEHNVLSRYLGAARDAQADLVVRITADCPLIDPEQSDRVIETLEANARECDYAANNLKRTFPRGLDTEAFSSDTLERASRLAVSAPALEHVTWTIYNEHPDIFMIRSVTDTQDNSDLRWTVDTPGDMSLVKAVYEGLNLGQSVLPYREVLAFVRAHPGIAALNADVKQKDVTATHGNH